MKHFLLILSIAFVSSMTIMSCGDKNTNGHGDATHEDVHADDDAEHAHTYACPMNCAGKTYDKAGNCTECGMALEVVEDHDHGDDTEADHDDQNDHADHDDHEGHDHDSTDNHQHED
jgi:hypothetical protein